jgi:Tfp pilus assembly protein PilO
MMLGQGEVSMHYVLQTPIELNLKGFYHQAMGKYILKAVAVLGRCHAAGMLVAHSLSHLTVDALHSAL